MIYKIFTVYDDKAECYMSPFTMQSTGAATRAFEDTVNDSNSAFNKHPSDYTLFEIGTFDDQNCTFTMYDAKTSLGSANEYINKPDINPLTAVGN